MSTAVPFEPQPSPADHGWVGWERLVAGIGPDGAAAMAPNYRLCSLPGCEETPVAAIRRGPSGARPPYWQPYCRGHAGDRGIEQTPAGLDWMPGFLDVGPVRRRARG